MPYGNPQAYKSGYIMGQMKKHGEMSEVDEDSLYREKLEFKPGIDKGTLVEAFPAESGNKPVSYTHLTLPTIYSV